MLKDDGSVWFSLNIQTSGRSSYESEIHKESEIVQIWYQDESQNKHKSLDYLYNYQKIILFSFKPFPKLYFELEKRPARGFWADRLVF